MKNLFSKSLSNKKLVVISASLLVFITATFFFIYDGTKKTVAITLDGQEKTIKTHADTIEDIFRELDISLGEKDFLSLAADTKVENNLEIVWRPAKQVKLDDDGKMKTYWTAHDTVKEFLVNQEIGLKKHDKLTPALETKIEHDMEIDIQRAFPVKIVDGGKEKEGWSTSTTVADFLSQQGIKLNEMDRVEPKLTETVDADTSVKVIRVEKVTDVVEEPINFAVVSKNDSNLAKGTQKVLNEGQEGLVSKTYEVVLENGKEVTRKLVDEKKIKDKQDKVVAMGTKVLTAQVSRGTSTASGKEMYVTSTAYTAGCNGCSGVTATGVDLRANPKTKIIAVDPNVIPLGTKVYVDGYGHAVAGDTGSAVKGNTIDVFLPSKAEAYRWGRKTVKIKILD